MTRLLSELERKQYKLLEAVLKVGQIDFGIRKEYKMLEYGNKMYGKTAKIPMNTDKAFSF